MRTHVWFVAILGAGALLAGYAAVPRHAEHAAMLVRDGLYDTAIEQLQALRGESRQTLHVLVQLQQARLRQGDVDGAIQALEDFLRLRPDDASARNLHVDLLARAGRRAEYETALQALVRDYPDGDRIRELLALLRRQQRPADEVALLTAHAGGPYVSLSDLERLGALLAERGDFVGAIRWLSHAAYRAPPIARVHVRLVDAMLVAGQSEAALAHAKRWLDKARDDFLAASTIQRFGAAGALVEARQLAGHVGQSSSRSVADIAGALVRSGFPSLGADVLSAWAAVRRDATSDEIRSFVAATVATGVPRVAVRALAEWLAQPRGERAALELASAVLRAYGPLVLAPVRDRLTPDILARAPLLGAELARHEGNPLLVRRFLAAVDPSRLDIAEQRRWLAHVAEVGPPGETARLLHAHWKAGRLPDDLDEALIAAASQSGQSVLVSALLSRGRSAPGKF
jgi:tetratricopeptide (TPR) repeat protein